MGTTSLAEDPECAGSSGHAVLALAPREGTGLQVPSSQPSMVTNESESEASLGPDTLSQSNFSSWVL